MGKEIIEKFYSAFQKKDWATMQLCYHDDATFRDPVFLELDSKQVRAMWHMLLQSDAAIELSYKVVTASENHAICDWEAKYKFSKTGRHVHNIITGDFQLRGGKIFHHVDTFDLWRWSGMALGWSGKLLGWAPPIRNKISDTARKGLFRFIEEHPEYK